MDPDEGGSRDIHQSNLKLKFHAGRFEEHIVYAIMLSQLMLGSMALMMGGFVLLSKDGLQLGFIAMAVMPLVIAYLLAHLYE